MSAGIPEPIRCPICAGTGEVIGGHDFAGWPWMSDCDDCLGTGRIVCFTCDQARATQMIDRFAMCDECAAEVRRESAELADADTADTIKRVACAVGFVLAAIVQQVVCQ